ncbi:hypothetical protein B0H14DRAFT_3722036 [Mycena olivaceomarginata]|nr:hypothetical protein B0H14DRAFT_3722036 [Mycena olivaceomarginata]
MNSLLVNTDSHFSDERLCNHLELVMCRDLLDDYRANPLAKSVESGKIASWLHELKCINDARLRAYLRIKVAVEEVERKLGKHMAANDNSNSVSKRPRSNGPSNSSSAGNSGVKLCPRLTEEKILDANQGCRHCCLLFQTTHCSSDKTCNFPSADPYVPVTQKWVDLLCKGKSKENAPPAAATAVIDHNYVAAVLPDIDDQMTAAAHRTAILLGFFMDGSAANFPVLINGLIDHGSHLLLITPELVDRRQLRRRLLHACRPLRFAVLHGPDSPGPRPPTTLTTLGRRNFAAPSEETHQEAILRATRPWIPLITLLSPQPSSTIARARYLNGAVERVTVHEVGDNSDLKSVYREIAKARFCDIAGVIRDVTFFRARLLCRFALHGQKISIDAAADAEDGSADADANVDGDEGASADADENANVDVKDTSAGERADTDTHTLPTPSTDERPQARSGTEYAQLQDRNEQPLPDDELAQPLLDDAQPPHSADDHEQYMRVLRLRTYNPALAQRLTRLWGQVAQYGVLEGVQVWPWVDFAFFFFDCLFHSVGRCCAVSPLPSPSSCSSAFAPPPLPSPLPFPAYPHSIPYSLLPCLPPPILSSLRPSSSSSCVPLRPHALARPEYASKFRIEFGRDACEGPGGAGAG